MKQKMLREDAHSREAETCRKRPRETPGCAKAHFLFTAAKHMFGFEYFVKLMVML